MEKFSNSSKYTLYDELEKLGSLKEKGIITASEFETEKAKLLNGAEQATTPHTTNQADVENEVINKQKTVYRHNINDESKQKTPPKKKEPSKKLGCFIIILLIVGFFSIDFSTPPPELVIPKAVKHDPNSIPSSHYNSHYEDNSTSSMSGHVRSEECKLQAAFIAAKIQQNIDAGHTDFYSGVDLKSYWNKACDKELIEIGLRALN